MKNEREISAMMELLEDNIAERGWDRSVDAASITLEWLFEVPSAGCEAALRRYMKRPEADRRNEWIADGGNPLEWPANEHQAFRRRTIPSSLRTLAQKLTSDGELSDAECAGIAITLHMIADRLEPDGEDNL